MTSISVAALIMVKNEQHRIEETIKSLTEFNGIIIYDTGSTDSTLNIIKTTCESLNIPVHIKLGSFVDFSTSRNESLDFADECCLEYNYTHIVLLDANDQIVGPVKDSLIGKNGAAYFVKQELKYSADEFVSFVNVKVLKALCGLRYKGQVHEYIDKCYNADRIDGFYIFQDRTLDDNKSKLRWERDRIILEKSYTIDPENTRTLFYLAQTYDCLGELNLAYDYYEKRSKSIYGFEEEKWQSLLKCGQISERLGKLDRAEEWYFKAIAHTSRAESLICLSKLYMKKNKFDLAYTFANLACNLKYPKNALLFIEKKVYDYERWHIMGIVAWYAAQILNSSDILIHGKKACELAISAGNNIQLDTKNLLWYNEV